MRKSLTATVGLLLLLLGSFLLFLEGVGAVFKTSYGTSISYVLISSYELKNFTSSPVPLYVWDRDENSWWTDQFGSVLPYITNRRVVRFKVMGSGRIYGEVLFPRQEYRGRLMGTLTGSWQEFSLELPSGAVSFGVHFSDRVVLAKYPIVEVYDALPFCSPPPNFTTDNSNPTICTDYNTYLPMTFTDIDSGLKRATITLEQWSLYWKEKLSTLYNQTVNYRGENQVSFSLTSPLTLTSFYDYRLVVLLEDNMGNKSISYFYSRVIQPPTGNLYINGKLITSDAFVYLPTRELLFEITGLENMIFVTPTLRITAPNYEKKISFSRVGNVWRASWLAPAEGAYTIDCRLEYGPGKYVSIAQLKIGAESPEETPPEIPTGVNKQRLTIGSLLCLLGALFVFQAHKLPA